jgi:hypothetical protein
MSRSIRWLSRGAGRAWAWFVGARHYEVAARTADGCMVSRVSGEQYTLVVRPVGHQVQVAIHCSGHQWLRHLASLESMGAEVLAVEVPPDEITQAREALIREADRLVRAIRAAWEYGWRPGA